MKGPNHVWHIFNQTAECVCSLLDIYTQWDLWSTADGTLFSPITPSMPLTCLTSNLSTPCLPPSFLPSIPPSFLWSCSEEWSPERWCMFHRYCANVIMTVTVVTVAVSGLAAAWQLGLAIHWPWFLVAHHIAFFVLFQIEFTRDIHATPTSCHLTMLWSVCISPVPLRVWFITFVSNSLWFAACWGYIVCWQTLLDKYSHGDVNITYSQL